MARQATGTKYQRKDGTWAGQITVKMSDGTTKRPTFYGTESEVQKWLDEMNEAKSKGKLSVPSKITFSEYVNETWLPYIKNNLKYTTYSTYESKTKNHLIPLLGSKRMQEITPLNTKQCITIISQNLSKNTTGLVIFVLKAIFKSAIEDQIVKENPTIGIKHSKDKTLKRIRFFSEEEVAQMVKAAHGTNFYEPIVFLFATGVRRGELLGLHWEDIDLVNNIVHIRHNLVPSNSLVTGSAVSITTPKTMTSNRKIPITQKLRDILDKLPRYGPLVFCRPDGSNISHSAINKGFKLIAKLAGIERTVSIHDTRHTFVTLSFKSGMDIKEVQELIGHVDASFLLNIYTHYIQTPNSNAGGYLDNML